MKKLYTTSSYKRWHKRKLKKIKTKGKKKSKSSSNINLIETTNKVPHKNTFNDSEVPVFAPWDLRLLDNLYPCLEFFRDLRSDENLSLNHGRKIVVMSLEYVKAIDYGTISILTSINDDLKSKGILLKTILPADEACKGVMVDSGYLNNLVDGNGNRFPRTTTSESILFEKGSSFLSENDNKKISLLIKNVVAHLTGTPSHCQPIRTIILEICGNSIEWSGTKHEQWLLCVKYDETKVIFTVTDVGRGILSTLYRDKKTKYIFDLLKGSDEILLGAFDKKYGSTTQEVNRNKGLPAVKAKFTEGVIKNLKVLTNNVILHFDDNSLSKQFEKRKPRFKGTFYQWEMTSECLNR